MQSSYILINIAPRSPTGYHSASVGSDYKWTFQPIMPEWLILGDTMVHVGLGDNAECLLF